MSSFFPARVPWLRTGKNDTIPVAREAPEAPVALVAVTANRWFSSTKFEKKSSCLEANRAKPSVRMKKQVPKNGIVNATVDSERG